MKKVIVAGAGHGGLVAAYHLAESGYDVTVFESKKESDIGWDWHDALDFSAFDDSGIPRPDESSIIYGYPSCFANPSHTVSVRVPYTEGKSIYMDRKELVGYLIDLASQQGVSFVFGASAVSTLCEGERVVGMRYRKDGKDEYAFCDLLIDASGMHSALRESLPASCKIQKSFPERDTFNVHRVYFENKTGELLDPVYKIELFHMNRPGLGWILTEKDRVDILVGKFGMSGRLTQKEIDEAIALYKKEYDFIGDEVIRGGVTCQIPLSRMLPVIVCDGYALVGDSAGMTVPLNGSGICLSMKAGKILAETVIAAGDKEITRAVLWKYEYEYFMKHGKDLVMIDILKNFFTYVTGEHVDYFLEKGILTENELNFDGTSGIEITPEYVKNLISVLPPVIGIVPALLKSLKTVPFIDAVAKQMPQQYDEEKVDKWVKKYRAL